MLSHCTDVGKWCWWCSHQCHGGLTSASVSFNYVLTYLLGIWYSSVWVMLVCVCYKGVVMFDVLGNHPCPSQRLWEITDLVVVVVQGASAQFFFFSSEFGQGHVTVPGYCQQLKYCLEHSIYPIDPQKFTRMPCSRGAHHTVLLIWPYIQRSGDRYSSPIHHPSSHVSKGPMAMGRVCVWP